MIWFFEDGMAKEDLQDALLILFGEDSDYPDHIWVSNSTPFVVYSPDKEPSDETQV